MRLKIMTYNLASTFGEDHRSDWKRSMEVIRAGFPDIVGCQEVVAHEQFNPELDMPSVYKTALAMNCVFSKACSRDGVGDYGVMTLSKYPLEEYEIFHFPHKVGREPRICQVLKVNAPKVFYFLCTHLEGEPDAIEIIAGEVEKKGYKPAVLVGDFNMTPDSAGIAELRREWIVFHDVFPPEATHHSGKKLDYLAGFPKGAFREKEYGIGTFGASDHAAVSAVLEFQ